MTVVVKGKSMRQLHQTRPTYLKPPIAPSEECVESKCPGPSAQTLGGAEKFIAEMMVVDVDQIILINIRHRLHHYHQQPPDDPKSSLTASRIKSFEKVSFGSEHSIVKTHRKFR
jgi:hypothetical protein